MDIETYALAKSYTDKKVKNIDVAGEVAKQLPNLVPDAVADYCDQNFSEWSGALDNALEQPNMAAPASKVGELKSALTLTTTRNEIHTPINVLTYAGFTTQTGSSKAVTQGVSIETNQTSYTTKYLVLDKACEVYFGDTSVNYLAICKGESYTETTVGTDVIVLRSSDAVRYRKSEGNLPTSENKLSFASGDVIAITYTAGFTGDIPLYGLDDTVSVTYSYSDGLADFIKDTVKYPLVSYASSPSARLFIYLPTENGFVKVKFQYTNNAEKNFEGWNIQPLYAVNNSLEELYAITTAGEFECALKEDGAPDFMGGTSHGDEIMSNILFILDGKVIDADDITEIRTFEELRVIENSTLYSANDGTTETAYHGKEYIFNRDGIKINQVIEWKRNVVLDDSYLAMFPVAKAITPYVCTNKKYEVKQLSVSGYFTEDGTDKAISFSDDFNAVFGIGLWDIVGTNLTNVGRYKITDNNAHPYNKQYFFCASSGSVANGTVWRTESYYQFNF